MKRTLHALLLASVLFHPCAMWAQAGRTLRVAEGTSVLIHPSKDLRSDKLDNGEQVRFLVEEPVLVDGVTLISAGAEVAGHVIKAKHASGFGQNGELNLAIDTVQAVDGTPLRLRATSSNKGGDNTALSVGLAVLVNVFAVFLQGREAVVPADRKITVYLNENRDFEVAPTTDGKSSVVRALPSAVPVALDPTQPTVTNQVMCARLSSSGAPEGVAESFSVKTPSVCTHFSVVAEPQVRYYEVKWYANERFVASHPVVVAAGQETASDTLVRPAGSTFERGDYKVLVLRNGNPESIQVFTAVP